MKVSSAIWCWLARVKFLKITKLHQPVGRVQFEVFKKFSSAYAHQIPVEIMLLNINNLHIKASQKVKTDEILTARSICNLHSCCKFAVVLHEKFICF